MGSRVSQNAYSYSRLTDEEKVGVYARYSEQPSEKAKLHTLQSCLSQPSVATTPDVSSASTTPRHTQQSQQQSQEHTQHAQRMQHTQHTQHMQHTQHTQQRPLRTSGLLVYLSDGRMWTQCHETRDDGKEPTYTGYTGRWWLHNDHSLGSFAPPHGGRPLVEHYVKAASDPELVGKTVIQQYALSADHKRLTTTDVCIFLGRACVMEQLEWRRLET